MSSSPSHFDRATALDPLSAGRFGGVVSQEYWVQSGPNGGYLAAIALRGASALVPEPERAPRSLHVRFLSAPKAGPFELAAELVRAGRSMTTIAVRLSQDGRDFVHASACFSAAFSPIAFQDATMPDALPIERAELLPARIALNERYVLRRAIGGGERSGPRAISGGWIRFADPRPFDALAMAALWDVWPPAVFARAFEQRFRGAVPTVEATVYFRRRLPLPEIGAEDSVLLRVESTMADEGFCEESAELWSPSGALLAQARQLALLL
ncbi:MAG TPA: thioesterase family protein [Polyangiales bacterium]|nr:thioesterase family protein [Polyangiales bacterium]